MKKCTVCIIGAGIAGLSAAIYLKRANIDFVILEGKMPGGKLQNIGEIENYPGFKNIKGPDLLDALLSQIESLGIEINYESVQSVKKENDGFIVTSDFESYVSKAVIVATGTIIKEVGVLGEKEFLGKGVSYCATCDGAFFKNKDVLVYGNNDASIEECLYLLNLVRHLYLVVQENEINASETLLERVKKYPNLEIIYKAKLLEIKGSEKVEKVKIQTENEEKEISVSGVFPLVGFKTSNQFLRNLDVKNKNDYLIVDEEKMTSVEGLFAIGDVIDKKVRQLVTAASDGAIASSGVKKYLRTHKN